MKEKIDKKLIVSLTIVIIIYLIISNPNSLIIAKSALTPLIFAFAIAYLLDKIVVMITEHTPISRRLSIFITVVGIVFLIIFLFAIVVPKLMDNAVELIEVLSNIDNFTMPEFYTSMLDNEYLLEINNYIRESVETFISKIGAISGELLRSVLSQAFIITSKMINFILAFVISIYMLIDKKDLMVRSKRLVFSSFDYKQALNIIRITEIADNIFSDFFIGKLIDSTIIGILCYFISSAINIPNALIIALIIGITNMIPYIGPFIGAIPVLIIILLIEPSKTLAMGIIIFVLQQFDGLVLGPIVLGDKLKVNAFWIIIAVTIGGAIYGFLGMLLGVPVLVLIKTIVEESIRDRLQDKNLYEVEELRLPKKVKLSFLERVYLLLKNKQSDD
jgi:predicted PurR-regulated permease PerM